MVVPTTQDKMDQDLFIPESELSKAVSEIEKTGFDWNTFEKIETVEERLQFLSKHYSSKIPEPKVASSIKDVTKALELKEEGNKSFKEKDYVRARELYTKSMSHYPINPDPTANKDYAIIVANRSAASEHLRIYEGVNQDVDMAIRYGYPRELQWKVWNRKGQALLKLKQFVDSKVCFQKCLDMIGKSDMPTKLRDQWRNRTKKHISIFGTNKKATNMVRPPHPYLNLADGASEAMPELSAKIAVEKGSVIAKRDINLEDGLLMESPAVKTLSDPRSYGKMCPYSLRKMAAPIPCSLGSNQLFYDEETRDKANASFHGYEWSILDDLNRNLAPIGRLALRIILKEDSEKIFAKINSENPSKDETFYCGMTAIYLEKCLGKIEFSTNRYSLNTCFRSVVIALRHKVPIFLCPKPENKSDFLRQKDINTVEFAYGIYPTYNDLVSNSKINNDTDDVLVHFVDDKIAVHSLKKIEQGKSINFKKAQPCAAFAEMVIYKCAGSPECTLSFPLKEKTEEQFITCPMENCGVETNIWKRLKRLHELKKDADVAKEIFEGSTNQKDLRKSIEMTQVAIDEFETFIFRPYDGLCQIEENKKRYILYEILQREEEWQAEGK